MRHLGSDGKDGARKIEDVFLEEKKISDSKTLLTDSGLHKCTAIHKEELHAQGA
jgi:hypothetical protein